MSDRPRPRGNRISSLEGWRRWCCVATIAVFGVLPVATAVRAAAQGWQATGDVAVIGLRSLDAWTTQAPLVGQTTTGEEYSGIPSNHPGPIANWTIGPVMRVLGTQTGILVGVGLINGASIAFALWLAFRRGGAALLAILAAMISLLVFALGPGALIDAFNSELPTFPIIATVLAAWSVLSGDLKVLPGFVVAASFAAQPHVAGATLVAPIVLIVIVGLAVRWRTHPARVRAARSSILWAIGAAAVCWLPPIVQELTGPSNVSALLRTQGSDVPRLGLAYVAERLATAVAPIPIWAHPSGGYGFIEDRGPIGVLLAGLIIGGAGSLAVYQRIRRGVRSPSILYGLVIAAVVVSMFVWSGSPPTVAFRVDSFRWLWVTSLLVWLTLIWAAWQWLPAAAAARARRTAPAVAMGVTALVAAWAVSTTHIADLRDHRFMGPTDELASKTLDELPPGSYHLRFEGTESLVTVGPALALRLERGGHPVSVDPGPFGRGYGTARTDRSGSGDRTILVANGTPELDPGDEVLATTTVSSRTGEPLTISVILEA